MKKEKVTELMTPVWDLLDKFDLVVNKHEDQVCIDCQTYNTEALYHLLNVFTHSGYRWDSKVSSVEGNVVRFFAVPSKNDPRTGKNLEIELAYKCCMLKSALGT